MGSIIYHERVACLRIGDSVIVQDMKSRKLTDGLIRSRQTGVIKIMLSRENEKKLLFFNAVTGQDLSLPPSFQLYFEEL